MSHSAPDRKGLNMQKDSKVKNALLGRDKQNILTYLVWAWLCFDLISALISQNWNMVFLATVVFGLTLMPFVFQSWADIHIPNGFVSAILVFIMMTIFLGEVGDFYERYWWWDIVLHTGSAIGFSMIGMVIVLALLRGDRLAAPPYMLAIMAFSFAVAIGAVWEIFEYAMDQIFGLNMQKSGLDDTMEDLIVDSAGAFIGAVAGYFYLINKGRFFLSTAIDAFVVKNPRFFSPAEDNHSIVSPSFEA